MPVSSEQRAGSVATVVRRWALTVDCSMFTPPASLRDAMATFQGFWQFDGYAHGGVRCNGAATRRCAQCISIDLMYENEYGQLTAG